MLPYMEELLPNRDSDMLFMMLTNIIDESAEILFVDHEAKAIVESAFEAEAEDNSVKLKGVVSRKKQVLGPLIKTIEAI